MVPPGKGAIAQQVFLIPRRVEDRWCSLFRDCYESAGVSSESQPEVR